MAIFVFWMGAMRLRDPVDLATTPMLIAAGGVIATATAWPDLIVGGLIASLGISAGWSVVNQALRELRVAGAPSADSVP
jgi:Co/Zn/Cd efflux system component